MAKDKGKYHPDVTPKGRGKGGGVGRPAIVLNDEDILQVQALAAYCTQPQIAGWFGFSERTLRAIMERQPEVHKAYIKGKNRAIASVGDTLLKKALDGDTISQIFYLKSQAGWRETSEVHHRSSGGTKHTYKVTFGGKEGVGKDDNVIEGEEVGPLLEDGDDDDFDFDDDYEDYETKALTE